MNRRTCARTYVSSPSQVRLDPPSLPRPFYALAVPALCLRLVQRARPPKRIHRLPLISALFVFVAFASPAAWAAPANKAIPTVDYADVFGTDMPLGRLSYQAGRGLRFGETGLVLGGFATLEAERLEKRATSEDAEQDDSDEDPEQDEESGESVEGGSRGGLEGLNLFVFFDPVSFAHLFAELEVGPLLELATGEGARSNPDLDLDRLYLDLGNSDALSVRLGKFLTPIGRRNLAPAEPLTWTTSEPLIVEEVFDESISGAMLFGSVFPPGGALSYSLYGQFLDPIDEDLDAPPAEHSAGARLEWASLGGLTLGMSYFASEIEHGEWNHLGGADFLWQPSGRLEVSGEAVFGEGSREDGALWGFYVEGAVETVPTLYAVGRYEHFDTPGTRRADLFDVGVAWIPAPYVRLKADYLIADQLDELTEPGLRMSLSILF